MNENNVIVLGSKPDEKILKIKFQSLYAANAAIEKAQIYKKINEKIKINSVCSLRGFLYDPPTSTRVKSSKLNRLIIRRGNLEKPKELNENCEMLCFDKKKQWKFQKIFFKYGFFSLILSEFFYGNSFKEGLINFKNNIVYKKGLLGVSTGFFAILLALKENPDKNIFVSGISMTDGGHFYDLHDKLKDVNQRRKVDKFLIKLLHKRYKKRMFSCDRDFANLANINYFENNKN